MESNIFSHSDIMSCVYDGYSTSKAYDWQEIKSGMSWTISVKVCPFCYDLDNEGKYSGIISQYKEDDNKDSFLGQHVTVFLLLELAPEKSILQQ